MTLNIPGESIAISAEFDNHSRRTVIPYATLYQTQAFFASGKSRVRKTKFTVLTGKDGLLDFLFYEIRVIFLKFVCFFCLS